MKKKAPRTREQLNQEYYRLAATIGDVELNIATLRRTKANLLSSLGVVAHQLKSMPLSEVAQQQVETDIAVATAQSVEAAEAPPSDEQPAEAVEATA